MKKYHYSESRDREREMKKDRKITRQRTLSKRAYKTHKKGG